ncbi:MAG: hypothetical protein V4501_11885 [Pseudomonadota bacterium]
MIGLFRIIRLLLLIFPLLTYAKGNEDMSSAQNQKDLNNTITNIVKKYDKSAEVKISSSSDNHLTFTIISHGKSEQLSLSKTEMDDLNKNSSNHPLHNKIREVMSRLQGGEEMPSEPKKW